MADSIYVYGPSGCGKTHNAERLKVALGMDRVLDELTPLPDGQWVAQELLHDGSVHKCVMQRVPANALLLGEQDIDVPHTVKVPFDHVTHLVTT